MAVRRYPQAGCSRDARLVTCPSRDAAEMKPIDAIQTDDCRPRRALLFVQESRGTQQQIGLFHGIHGGGSTPSRRKASPKLCGTSTVQSDLTSSERDTSSSSSCLPA